MSYQEFLKLNDKIHLLVHLRVGQECFMASISACPVLPRSCRPERPVAVDHALRPCLSDAEHRLVHQVTYVNLIKTAHEVLL